MEFSRVVAPSTAITVLGTTLRLPPIQLWLIAEAQHELNRRHAAGPSIHDFDERLASISPALRSTAIQAILRSQASAFVVTFDHATRWLLASLDGTAYMLWAMIDDLASSGRAIEVPSLEAIYRWLQKLPSSYIAECITRPIRNASGLDLFGDIGFAKSSANDNDEFATRTELERDRLWRRGIASLWLPSEAGGLGLSPDAVRRMTLFQLRVAIEQAKRATTKQGTITAEQAKARSSEIDEERYAVAREEMKRRREQYAGAVPTPFPA